jgi:hypothetical protein
MKKLLVLMLIFSFSQAYSSEMRVIVQEEPVPGFSEYDYETEIPEPLYFDLVRRLDSKKGEWEVNTLFSRKRNGFSQFEIAPEIELVPMDGLGIEFELPMRGGSVESYKTAVQYTLGEAKRSSRYLHGVQAIYENYNGVDLTEYSLLYLYAYRISKKVSFLGMLGPRIDQQKNHSHMLELINFTLFYNFSREVDFGIEINNEGLFDRFEQIQLMPQIHLALGKHYKIQFGFGSIYDGHDFSPVSAFRLIYEQEK